MVNLKVRGRVPLLAVVRRDPVTTLDGAAVIGLDIVAVALEDNVAGITTAALLDPVREQLARVAVHAAAVSDGQALKL